jgi:hypothetical protein
MATADYRSSADLKAVAFGGLINESVMQQIIDVLDIDTPLTSMIGSTDVGNSYHEWTQRIYQPAGFNSHVDGSDAAAYQAKVGARVGNQCQISRKNIAVTTRARHSDTIGVSDEFTENLMVQTEQLRRDVEYITLSNQASVADDGDSTPGKTGGLNAWLTTNTDRGVGGVDGGFSSGVVSAATLGTVRAITEDAIRNTCQSIYEQGFDASVLMARPDIIRLVSEYMFTDTARIGIQQTETGKGGASTAVGSVKVFITDFDIELMLKPNRLQPYMDAPATALNDSAFILDPKQLMHGYLHGYRTEPLAKTGLADKSQVAVDWCLVVLAEQGLGVVADIDASTPMLGSAP